MKAASIDKLTEAQIDTISGATPSTGTQSVTWDLRDFSGNPVPAGSYRYLVEANISWDKRVLWIGTITIDEKPHSSTATPNYSTPDAAAGAVISNVTAQYNPAR